MLCIYLMSCPLATAAAAGFDAAPRHGYGS